MVPIHKTSRKISTYTNRNPWYKIVSCIRFIICIYTQHPWPWYDNLRSKFKLNLKRQHQKNDNMHNDDDDDVDGFWCWLNFKCGILLWRRRAVVVVVYARTCIIILAHTQYFSFVRAQSRKFTYGNWYLPWYYLSVGKYV